VRHALGDLSDCIYSVLFAESLEHPERDIVARGGAWRLLGAFFGQELGNRAAELGAVRVHDLLAQQLVVVVHLVKGPAFCRRQCALSLSVKALTEADEPRFRRPSKLTKVAVAG
jgi:hypothetical protein